MQKSFRAPLKWTTFQYIVWATIKYCKHKQEHECVTFRYFFHFKINSFLLQAVIFSGDIGDDGGPRCVANFVPGWGVQGYVTWFAVSSFFVPLLFLVSHQQ